MRARASRGRAVSCPKMVTLPRAGPREARQDAQQRGLARAVAPEQRQARARLDAEADVAQGRIVAVELPDARDLDRVHPRCLPLASPAR